jgi:N-acetylmuramoyl-L-alanine amidase
LLEAEGFEVIMTRDDDTFIPLEERTAIANSRGADLFLSLHCNASRNRRARGIETYYLNLATTPEAEETAARENAVSTRSMSDLQPLLRQIMNNSKIAESRDFAGRIQKFLATTAHQIAGSRNLGVKTAPFYVLLGATMPAVLVETSFVSNPEDAALLAQATFRSEIARSVFEGILGYATSLKRVATTEPGRVAGSPQ